MTLALLCAIGSNGRSLSDEPASEQEQGRADNSDDSRYALGPGDQVTIWALGVEEVSEKPFRLDPGGYLDLPLLGRVPAMGLTAEQLKAELVSRLKNYVQEPQVAVRITEFKSQPVSVIGAVKDPGVHQLEGRKTLIEILSMAGGLAPDAGHGVKITRRREWGRIPLPTAQDDPTGEFSVAELSLRAVMEASNPEQNIIIRPHDVISVPRAEMVYVMGEVVKPGAFVLNERETVSVLQALSMAGGFTRTAAPGSARILRPASGSGQRAEISLDLKKVLAGKSRDVALQPQDILFVPHNTAKSVGIRAAEAAIGIGTGVIIWRR